MKVEADEYFAIIPEWVLYGDITASAVRVYAVLNRYANSDTGKCHPSRKSIAAKARIGLSTVDRAIDELVAFGAVTVRHQKSETGDHTSNEYTLKMNRGLSTMNRPSPQNEQTGLFKSDNQTIAILNQSQESESSSSNDDGFNQFWQMYPRKVGKDGARTAFKRARKKTSLETILAGLHLYNLTRPKETHYIAHPTTWLNQGRWADEQENLQPTNNPDSDAKPIWQPCGNCWNGWVEQPDNTLAPCPCTKP